MPTDVQAAYAALAPEVRAAAIREMLPRRPWWVTREDLEQMTWEALGLLAERYEPTGELSHYVSKGFRYALGRCLRRTYQAGRNARGTAVESWPHTLVNDRLDGRYTAADGTRPPALGSETPALAESAACAELLRHLPALERHALWLCAVEGLSFTQASARLGVPRSSVFAAYKRAVAWARDYWREEAA